MINIGSLHPPVSTPKIKQKSSKEAAVAGSKITKDAPKMVQPKRERRQRKDRRQKTLKPLVDLRTGGDRREDPATPSIDIEV